MRTYAKGQHRGLSPNGCIVHINNIIVSGQDILSAIDSGKLLGSRVSPSDIPVTETQNDTEMIDISKTHTETNTEKIFNTDTIYI